MKSSTKQGHSQGLFLKNRNTDNPVE